MTGEATDQAAPGPQTDGQGAGVRALGERIPRDRAVGSDEALEIFLDWTLDKNLELYPAQEEAVLEVMGDRHVILATPTGSGKSLVALAGHFRALCMGERSFYTSPIKALVSEKFFALCRDLGGDNVGMLTGDASINRDAPVVCCTAEVLANIALREGEHAPVDHVVMDEFHYYADPDRGMAWQIPLISLPHATFLLMSATLGDTRDIELSLQARTGREVKVVRSRQRPVPLSFEYALTPVHDTVSELLSKNRAPIYLVSTSQREAAEEAQNLMSIAVCDKAGKAAIGEAIGHFRFDSAYGRELQRFVRHGVGLHHAGLLPKYRLLVEQLAQQGLLKVISGTDTLGVGINIPLRTVLLTRLCKYDGEKTRLLKVRELLQIAGRAGRKGFDDQGYVVCQAPAHVIENRRLEARSSMGGQKKKFVRRKPPERGFVPWNEAMFRTLVDGSPERLDPVFRVDTGIMMSMLQRPEGPSEGLRALVALIDRSHAGPAEKLSLRRSLARRFRSLRAAGVVKLHPRAEGYGREVALEAGLQDDFSLHHGLSLYLVETLSKLDPDAEQHALDVVTVVEAILEHPHPILRAQVNREKGALVAQLKAEGLDYEERRERLESVTWPMPGVHWLRATLEEFEQRHPWVQGEVVRPKSIARELLERFCSFDDYVRELGLERVEGLLLRYLSQVYRTLVQNVPESEKTDDVVACIGVLRAMLGRVDSSLVQQWEQLREGGRPAEVDALAALPFRKVDISRDTRTFYARLRAEMHALLRALAREDWAEAHACIWQAPEDPWTEERLQEALAPFELAWGRPRADHAARLSDKTRIEALGGQRWSVVQTLLDAEEEADWCIEAEVDLGPEGADPAGPLLCLRRIGP